MVRFLPIETPVHASCHYTREEALALLDYPTPLRALLDCSDRNSYTIVGGYNDSPLRCATKRALFQEVIHEVLAKPIIWNNTVAACSETIKEQAAYHWHVRTFGPDLMGRRLASSLQGIKGSSISYAPGNCQQTTEINAGTRPPIAVIGMAGRFPSAANPDELWELLRRGTDCHIEVRMRRILCCIRHRF
jgi:hypothetical protein